MANLPAHPGEALWIGGAAGKNHYNIGIGQGTSGGANHEDFGQDLIEDGYTDANKFRLNSDGNVEFRINAGAGRTSSNTAHPRSELREYLLNGTSKAAWDGRSGEHYLKARCRLIETTGNKPWVCFGQIHGSEGSPEPSDLVRLQTEGDTGATTGLSIVCRRSPPGGGGEIRTVLRTGYSVGTWFDYEIRMSAGRLRVFLDGTAVLDVTGMGQILCYFKAGCYLQDNVEKGASASAYAGMEFERGSLVTWHTGTPNPTTPVFTGSTDPGGGAGGGAGNDTAPPTVPQNLAGVRGNNQATLSWAASTDNVGVAGYRVYRFSATGAGGGAGTSSVLGQDEGGASTTLSSADKMVASRFTAAAAGTLTAGHFRAWLSAAGSTLSKMAVYADSSGVPGTRLAVSDEITISATTEGVRDYAFSGVNQISIVADTDYWVAASWDDPGTPSLTFSRDGLAGQRVESTATYGTPPTPFGTISGTFTGPIDAWCDVVSGTGAGTGGGGTTTTVGKTTDAATSSASSADKTAVSSATAAASGTLSAGHARAWLSGAGSATTKMAVYANSGGAPGARLATSDPKVITNTSESLVDYVFSAGDRIAITSGVTYWVGLAWVDPGAVSLNISRDVTANARQEVAAYAPTPFGTPTPLTGPIDAYVDVVSGGGGGQSGAFALLATTAGLSYTDTGLTNGQAYLYKVAAFDAAGNESAQSTQVSVTPGPPDVVAPTVPTGLAATAGDSRVTLSWTASTDTDAGMGTYRVYRDGTLLATTAATSYVDIDAVNGTLYSYRVSAVDLSLNESAQAAAVTATPAGAAIGGAALLPNRLAGGKLEVAIAWGANLAAAESTWTWTDVTADVRHDPGISCSLGRNDESSTSNPAELTLVLTNTLRRYSLGTASPNYPFVRRGTPVRVRVDPGGGVGGRLVFLGFANGFTPGWDDRTGRTAVVILSASGALRRLSQGSAPVRGVYRRTAEALASVKAYWPLEEGSAATFGANVRGGSIFHATTAGNTDWAADSSFPCSAPLPDLGGTYLNATVNAYPATGANQVRWLMSLPDDGLPDGTVIAHISFTGSIHRWDLTYEIHETAGHCIGVYRYLASDGSLLGLPEFLAFGADVLGGFTGRMSLSVSQSGSNLAWSVKTAPARFARGGFSFDGTVSSQTCGIVDQLEFNPHSANVQLVVGHVTVENALSSNYANSDALLAHEGEYITTGGRLQRLCDENRVPLQFYAATGAFADLDRMGAQLVAPLLDLLRECELAEQGQLWDGRGVGLQYTTRRRRQLGTVKLVIDAADGELGGDFAPVDDDQRTRNKVAVTRARGVTYTHEDASGPLGTATVGIYDDAVTVNTFADDSTVDYGEWFVRLGTVVGYRYPSVTVDLAASPHLAAAVLGIVPGERIDVTNLDTTLAEFPDASVSLIVEGITHEMTTRSWRATFRCSPYSPWAIGLGG